MGLTIEDSLQNMLGRVDSMSVRTFVQAIIQGQMLGVSIGKILRDLAIDMRKRRRQMAEERAQKAPTKILFPLVFLILPALMIIVLGGPVMGLGRALGGNLSRLRPQRGEQTQHERERPEHARERGQDHEHQRGRHAVGRSLGDGVDQHE